MKMQIIHTKDKNQKKLRYNMDYISTVGRRKTSVARVTLVEGSGKYTFNGKDISQYFPSPSMKMTIEKPFKVVNMESNFDVIVNVSGSGLSAQSDAVSLGISRAL